MQTAGRFTWAKVRHHVGCVWALVLLLALPHLGSRAMLIGAALGLILLCFTTEFTPGPLDRSGRRVRVGFIALSAIMVAWIIYTLFQQWRPGH